MSRILVVGGDSRIGRLVAEKFRTRGFEVSATTRRAGEAGEGRPFLDLAHFDPATARLPEADWAILAAAVARLGACAAEPDATARVNVGGTLRLARHLEARGVRVLLLSSDKVFDGRLPRRCREDGVSPESEYGRQKALAEAGIRALGPSGAILRLSKVLAADEPLIAGWVDALRRGEPIRAFDDMYLAPVQTDLVADLLARIVESGGSGIYQASGAEEVSYAGFAARLARRLGVAGASVLAEASDPALHPLEARPRHSTLEMRRERDDFAVAPPGIEEVLATLEPAA